MKHLFKVMAVFFMLSVGIITLSAQGTQGIISGTVTDDRNEPLIGATVQVKNESTGFYTGTATNVTGEYILKQLPLGSPYTITVTYIGYGEQKKDGYSLNQGDLLKVDFVMTENAVQLSAVEVVSNSLKKTIFNTGAATAITANDITKLPVNGRNYTSLVGLSPLSSGTQLAGQLASSTNFTIDGMTSRGPTSGGTTNRGPYSISMEAIREFEISTNQYDVTYGRAGGGTISTVTKSGTNQFKGSAFSYMRTDWLSSSYNASGNKRSDEYSIYQYGLSLGGPIIKNRAHFFVAWDHQADSRPLYIADIHNEDDENRYNVTQATLDRYLQIARDKYGVAGSRQVGSFDKKRGSDAVFARIDWQLNATNLVTIRNNFVRDMNNQGVGDNSSINLYEVYGSHLSKDNSFLATLRSVLSPKLVNELKAQHLYTLDHGTPSTQLPGSNIPRAIVERIESVTSGGKEVNTTIQLGGQRYLAEKFKNNVFQLVDNLYYSTKLINYTFGVDVMYTNLSSLATSEMNGRFYFTGMENFDNLKPYRYAREVPLINDPTVNQDVLTTALYAQIQMTPWVGFNVMAGLRADYTNYFTKPAFNRQVYNELGLSTNHSVKGFQMQPRVQITWDVNDKHTDIVRAGTGVFGSALNNYSMINNLLNDGTKVAAVDIQGANVPVPNFEVYRKDPSKVPGKELFDLPGVAKVSTINMNGENVKVPVIYKANLSYTHFFSDRIKASASFFGSWGRNNYMYIDRNMVDDPFFRLANEGNRGIYVPAASISQSGTTDWMLGRKSENVGRVLELVSEGKVNQYALVVDGTIRYLKDGEITLSYTWNDVKDNTSYNGNVANSATLYQMVKDDPRDLSRMNYSDSQFRHKIVFYGTAPTFYGVSIGARFSGMGGSRYSLVVNGNVNGDFVNSNDLAYIFDPSDVSVPENIRTGLNAILNNPDANESVKEYIRNNMGEIAARNGGVNGFYGVFDLKISKNFKIYKQNSLELSLDIFNVANLLNKDWGINKSLSNQRLYTISGFDQVTKTYTYRVNENAGVPVPSGDPYQIQVGLRYAF